MSRNRFRRASTSLPGYDDQGFESFGHPASQAQPAVDAYGIESEFGEGVHEGPYRSGPAPASYGWEADHPAATEDLISDYEETSDLYEQNLRKAMERKASKCIEIAESRLGRTASQDEIEDLALRYMDLPSRQINAKLQRIAGTQYKRNDAHKKNRSRRDEALKKNKNKELMSEEEFGEIMASDFLADDVMQEGTGYDGDDVGPGNHMADFMADDEMAEEIAMLKAANARLSSQMRRMAEDVVQQETGYEGDDESVDTLDDEEGEGPTKKLASEMMAEDMAILAEMMQEASEMGDADRMAEILAEMDRVARAPYGTALKKFKYQDPDTRGLHRALGRKGEHVTRSWKETGKKKTWNRVNYEQNKHRPEWWNVQKKKTTSKKAELMAEDILSDEEFAEIMAEMDHMSDADHMAEMGHMAEMMREASEMGDADRMADIMAEMTRIAKAKKKKKPRGKARGQYGASNPGWSDSYMEPESRAEIWKHNRLPKDSPKKKKKPNTGDQMQGALNAKGGKNEDKSFYNHEYYVSHPELWPSESNPQGSKAQKRPYKYKTQSKMPGATDLEEERRVNKKAHFDEMRLASEEQAMLNEMLAEMEAEMAMAGQNDPSHFYMTAEDMTAEDMLAEMMAEDHEAEDHEAEMMAEDHEAEDVMGLHMASDNVDVDPKLARIFQAAEEEASEEEASEEEATEEEATLTQKSASFRPQTRARQASVKTLGNISREASSASDELSKLWESAPDVSKYFG
tara:strand:+ start:13532 stop:15760 length:2229 start_codon:yes stop_codon:yes gene_type:complete